MHNRDLEDKVDTTDQWIFSRTGIRQRHIAAAGQSSSDLADLAARQAMERGGVQPQDVDLVIVATTTPEKIFPATACLVQQRLGLARCPAFDIQAVCAGFVYALGVADQFIRNGAAQCALVIGTEVMSRILDWTDRSTCILFGDGAGAVIAQAADEPGILSMHLYADGSYSELLHAPGGCGRTRQDDQAACLVMNGSEVFRLAVSFSEQAIDEACRANGLERGDIDWLVPHQANVRIISAMARKLDLPMERVVSTVEQHGNTSAASVPLALDIAMQDGRIQPGHKVLLVGFGAGFTWGSVLLQV